MNRRTSTVSDVALVHVNAAADKLGLSPYQVRGLIDAGRLPSEKVGNRTYIPAAALAAYIERIGQAS